MVRRAGNELRGIHAPTRRPAGFCVCRGHDRRTSPANIEKDFWICFVLDALFKQRPRSWPALLFRGGTSLSKAFGLINRFSEDIDVAIDRDDFIGESLSELEKMSDYNREHRLAELSERATEFVRNKVVPHLNAYFAAAIENEAERPKISVNKGDPLTIEVPYKAVSRGSDGYVRSIVRLEFSIRAALTPDTVKSITPYIAGTVDAAGMVIKKLPTISDRRTFWDKILIVHEIKERFGKESNPLRADERVSRHYYDLYKLIVAKRVGVNKNQIRLARNCQRHSRLFYPTPGVDLAQALPGSFDTIPGEDLRIWLERDYAQMSVMIFGSAPTFDQVLKALAAFQQRVNNFASRNEGTRSAA